MTGQGRGRCGGGNARGEMPPGGPGFGMGRGGGRGGGWRHRHGHDATSVPGCQRDQMGWPEAGAGFTPARSREQELAALKQQAESLQQTLADLNSRIQELDRPTRDTRERRPG
jgi:hypothetical protein